MSLFPLSEKWTPNQLLVRDKQLTTLLEASRPENAKNLWITGDRGLGKSLTAKIFSTMTEGAFLLICTSQSFKDSVRTFALSHGLVPKAPDNPVTIILSVLTKEEHKHLTLIFDDVDKLGRYFRRDFSPYLHDLYDRLLETNSTFSIHIATTTPYKNLERFLSAPTLSRLKLKPLNFPRYSQDEILLLLKQRLTYIEGLTVENGTLELISQRVARIGGDFRKALEITRNSIQNNALTFQLAESAWVSEKENFWMNQILELPFHQAILLASIIEETLSLSDNPENPPYLPVCWRNVKNRYLKHCLNIGYKPLREKMQYYWLEQLWLKNWVDKFTLSSKHEWNYIHERGLFLRLLEKLENLVEPIKKIDWTKAW